MASKFSFPAPENAAFNPRMTAEEILGVRQEIDAIDALYACSTLDLPGTYMGWLYNAYETFVVDAQKTVSSALECYFMRESLETFKVTLPFSPYFYIKAPPQNYPLIESTMRSLYAGSVTDVLCVERDDLTTPNHVSGLQTLLLKVVFRSATDCTTVSRALLRLLATDLDGGAVPKLAASSRSVDDCASYAARSLLQAKEVSLMQARVGGPPRATGTCHSLSDMAAYVNDVIEYDVPLTTRVFIDMDFRCSCWYDITIAPEGIVLARNGVRSLNPAPKVFAFDIETSKHPLRFPRAESGDQIMCISYMFDTQGYLLVNRSVFSQDIADFEYSPRADLQGPFACFNLPDEEQTIRFFFRHIREGKPNIFVSFNGDFFDWSFIEVRAAVYGLSMYREIGVYKTIGHGRDGNVEQEFRARSAPHLDCFRWVRRDSYLPQGSQGLKAVTRAKLKYNPLELDPELMTPYAQLHPQVLASYSVSDAVATYYLYMKYVHPFIFALGTIIPLVPDEILRKGTGTLCECLLMVEAYKAGVPFPRKFVDPPIQTVTAADGTRHILQRQTYVGGRVEALNAGVFRSDVEYDFHYYSQHFREESDVGYRYLVETVDRDLMFLLVHEGVITEALLEEYGFPNGLRDFSVALEDVRRLVAAEKGATARGRAVEGRARQSPAHDQRRVRLLNHIRYNVIENYDAVRQSILDGLAACSGRRHSKALIYHLDVSAMYPNIILTNRLQPQAIVEPSIHCASCDYNLEADARQCQRFMDWVLRIEYFPCDYSEYLMISRQLAASIPGWNALGEAAKVEHLVNYMAIYSAKQYKAKKVTEEITQQTTVCQRENSFYVDTVRAFRDRRYVYKGMQKDHQGTLNARLAVYDKLLAMAADKDHDVHNELAQVKQDIEHERAMVVLAESLQLAHKCILNSFYGYVMRKGSRWFSMKMAAAVTHTGGLIIRHARALIERIGFALELDTDGIWCCLPGAFPGEFSLRPYGPAKKPVKFQYPAIMLNASTAEQFTNHQFLARKAVPGEESGEAELHADAVEKGGSSLPQYTCESECSVEFELDGPYSCMVLSASKEEGIKIKKRYAVFDMAGKLSELKGFELKRRGELQLIKSLQGRIFGEFLKGHSLSESYEHASRIANVYLDALYSRGSFLTDSQLTFLIAEASTMKNSLVNTAANRKSTAITCAKRLSSFLDPIFREVAGLKTEFIISEKPLGLPVTERAIPIQIFSSAIDVRVRYLRMWTEDSSLNTDNIDIRNIIDWAYYTERLANTLLKILVVPAGLQGLVQSPLTRIPFPPWIQSNRQAGRTASDNLGLILKNLAQPDATKGTANRKSKAKSTKVAADIEDIGLSSSNDTDSHESSESEQPDELTFPAAEDDKIAVLNSSKNDCASCPAVMPGAHAAQPNERSNHLLVQDIDPYLTTITDQAVEPLPKASTESSAKQIASDLSTGSPTLRNTDQAPDRATDYVGWIEWNKKFWAILSRQGGFGQPLSESMGAAWAPSSEKVGGVLTQLRPSHRNMPLEDYFGMNRSVEFAVVATEIQTNGKIRCDILMNSGSWKQIVITVLRRFYVNIDEDMTEEAVAALSTDTIKVELAFRASASNGVKVKLYKKQLKDELMQKLITKAPTGKGSSMDSLSQKQYSLPRHQRIRTLICYSMTDDTFKDENETIQALLSHPSVMGMYETEVPHAFRFATNGGIWYRLQKNPDAVRRFRLGEVYMSDIMPIKKSMKPDSHDTICRGYRFFVRQDSSFATLSIDRELLHSDEQAGSASKSPCQHTPSSSLNTHKQVSGEMYLWNPVSKSYCANFGFVSCAETFILALLPDKSLFFVSIDPAAPTKTPPSLGQAELLSALHAGLVISLSPLMTAEVGNQRGQLLEALFLLLQPLFSRLNAQASLTSVDELLAAKILSVMQAPTVEAALTLVFTACYAASPQAYLFIHLNSTRMWHLSLLSREQTILFLRRILEDATGGRVLFALLNFDLHSDSNLRSMVSHSFMMDTTAPAYLANLSSIGASTMDDLSVHSPAEKAPGLGSALHNLVSLLLVFIVAERYALTFSLPLCFILNSNIILPHIYLTLSELTTSLDTLLLDIIFARECAKNNMVLWASPHSTSKSTGSGTRELWPKPPIISNPGMYHGVTISYELHNILAHVIVSTLGKPPMIPPLSALSGQELAEFPSAGLCQRQTQVLARALRQMLSVAYVGRLASTNVSHDSSLITTIESSIFSKLCSSLELYISNPCSLMYDEGILSYVMDETHTCLLAIQDRFLLNGYRIVYLSAKQLIASSDKLDYRLVISSYKPVYNDIVNSELLHKSCLLAPSMLEQTGMQTVESKRSVSWYQFLLFIDKSNFFGYSIFDTVVQRSCFTSAILDENLCTSFDTVISAYLIHLNEKVMVSERSLPHATKQLATCAHDFMNALRDKMVTGQITHGIVNLQAIADSFMLRNTKVWNTSSVFEPFLRQHYLQRENISPGLYYLRSLCAFLGLDPYCGQDADAILKGFALAMNFDNFLDDRLRFHELLPSYTCYNIPCRLCGSIVDLDISSSNGLLCTICGNHLEPNLVEAFMLTDFHNMVEVFFAQEPVCSALCGANAHTIMSTFCSCRAEKCLPISAQDGLASYISLFASLAEIYSFTLLAEATAYVKLRL